MGHLARLAAALIRPLFGDPEPPAAELLRAFPELARARWRRGGVPAGVAGWVLGTPGAASITLWRTVFLGRDAVASAELLLHELRHVHQFEASLVFPARYLLESLRRGYSRNRYEADACAWAADRLRDWSPSPPSEDV